MLQELLAGDARLLGGAATGEAAMRRWILIARESPVRGASGQTWSADHVFVDDEGVPTVVEVKRASNSQIRREVIGQLLDYASNLAASTTAQEMRERYEDRILATGGDPAAALSESLGTDVEPDAFWSLVGENLARGRIRGFVVADVIPEELRRVIDFLNRQIGESRYVGLEVPQFQTPDGTTTTLVPQIVAGLLDPPTASSSGRTEVGWSADQVVQSIRDKGSQAAADVAQRLVDWARERDLEFVGGRGPRYPAVAGRVRVPGRPVVIRLWGPNGTLELHPEAIAPPLVQPDRAAAVLARLVGIPGFPWTKRTPPAPTDSTVGGYLEPLRDERLLVAFLAVMDEIVDAYLEPRMDSGG